jgi:hypothetical protein
MQQLVYSNYLSILNFAGVKKAIESKNDGFFFSRNDTANRAANKQLHNMAKQMDYLLLSGVERSWKQGEENFWDKLKLTFSKTAREQKAFDQIRETATQSARDKTAQSFYHEKRGNGLNISNRVWNLAGNAKKEIEIILQNGIKEGKGADAITKSLKGYLNEPDKLFRRVRNGQTGELELSKAAQKYKPGRGVYRSAYKNIMRLARTEMKAANCEAVWASAQNNPLVTGWNIVLSNNHTTLIDGISVPFKDICDKLQGTYPKSFKFKGWHPQCRCEMLPVTITQDERKDLYKSIFDNKRDEWKPESGVKQPPEAFTEWINENRERAKGWSSMPQFVHENAKFVKDEFKVNIYSDEEKKFMQARKTQEAMQRVLKEMQELYPNIENTELAAIHHYTRAGGNYRQLNKQLDKGTLADFNKAASTLISQGLQGLPKVTGTVYRGTIIKRKDFERLYSGNETKHNIFTSSNQSFDIAEKRFAGYREPKKNEVRVIFEIESKNGRDISKISEFNGNFAPINQQEVLFDKGAKFKIVDKAELSDGTILVQLMEL